MSDRKEKGKGKVKGIKIYENLRHSRGGYEYVENPNAIGEKSIKSTAPSEQIIRKLEILTSGKSISSHKQLYVNKLIAYMESKTKDGDDNELNVLLSKAKQMSKK